MAIRSIRATSSRQAEMFSKGSGKTPDVPVAPPAEALNSGGTVSPMPRGAAVPSIISADLKITGNLTSSGDIQVDGAVEGDISSRTLTVGEDAHIDGSIVAESVRVCGQVSGEVRATSDPGQDREGQGRHRPSKPLDRGRRLHRRQRPTAGAGVAGRRSERLGDQIHAERPAATGRSGRRRRQQALRRLSRQALRRQALLRHGTAKKTPGSTARAGRSLRRRLSAGRLG